MSNRSKTPKPGPLKATVPIASATKEGCGLWSPTPPWRSGLGQRSPGHNGKLLMYNSGNVMKRTASLDTIYFKDTYPREHWRRDRATQTEFSNSLDSLPTTSNLPLLETADDKLARLSLRARRKSISKDLTNLTSDPNDEQNIISPQTISYCNIKANAPKSSRSSEEGLNQEIEGIILRSVSDPQCSDRLRQPTPEGRKAPVADLLRKRSGNVLLSDAPSRDTLSPIPGHLETAHSETEDSQDSSPDNERMNTSPRINKFQKEPPDGCINLFKAPIVKPIPKEATQLSTPYSYFTLTPSLGSAFECLTNNEKRNQEEQGQGDVPLVPDLQKDLS